MTDLLKSQSKLSVLKSLAIYSLFVLWGTLTFTPALAEVSYVVAFFAWFFWHIFSRTFPKLPPRSVFFPLCIFMAGVVLSYFTSEFPRNSLSGIWKIAKLFWVFLMTADLFSDPKTFKRFETVFWIVAWVVLINTAVQFFHGKDLLRMKPYEDSGAGIRLTGSFGTYGKLASYLVVTIPFLFTAIAAGWNSWSWPKRIFSSLLFAGSSALLFYTKSRGAILSFVLGLGLVLLLRKQFKILVFLLLAGIAAIFVLPRNMVIHLDADKKEQSIVERFTLWDRAIHVIKAKPWTGTGINTYADAHAKYDQTNSWRVKNYYAHNGYLQLAAETGIPCTAALLWFLAVYLIKSFSKIPVEPERKIKSLGLLAGILNFLIFTMVDTVFQSPQPVVTFWYLLGAHWAYQQTLQG